MRDKESPTEPNGAEMKARTLVVILGAEASPDLWVQGATEARPPHNPRPRACKTCPIRKGGELEDAARDALERMSLVQRKAMRAWSCHNADRPCANMLRLAGKP